MIEPITKLRDLQPGDIGLGPIGGAVGLGVALGQLLLGEGWRLDGDKKISIRHACIVTQSTTVDDKGVITKGKIVEAMPSGAREADLSITHWAEDWAWVRLPEDYPGQAVDAAELARSMVGTPYSIASYLYLAQWRLGLSTKRTLAWINRRGPEIPWLRSGGRATAGFPREAICSVLVDQAWTLTGKKIMHGVPYQCVTPKQLANTLRFKTDGASWGFPGR